MFKLFSYHRFKIYHLNVTLKLKLVSLKVFLSDHFIHIIWFLL